MEGDFFTDKEMEECISKAGKSLKYVKWSDEERDFIYENE